MRNRAVAAIAWLIVALVPGTGLAGTAQAASTAQAQGRPNALEGVSCYSEGNCAAVGYYNNGTKDQTLVESLANGAWGVGTSPDQGNGATTLLSVSCPQSGECVAVGYYQQNGVDRALIETLPGPSGGWATATAADIGTGANVLNSVSCVGTKGWCTAVGYYDDGGVDRPLVEDLSANKWSLATPAADGSSTNVLEGVSCTSSAHCWAVGYYAKSGTDQSLAESYSGSTWKLATSANDGTHANELFSVSCLSTTVCTAVGYYSNGTHNQSLAEELSSSGAFKLEHVADSGTLANVLKSVSCAGPTGWCTAVGYYDDAGKDQVLAAGWNGTTWALEDAPDQGTGANELAAVSCPDQGWCAASGYSVDGAQDQSLNEMLSSSAWGIWAAVNVTTPTSITLATSVSPVAIGQAFTLTATVKPAPDAGTVAFSVDGAVPAGCSAVPVVTGQGMATCTTEVWTGGDHDATAFYSGDDLFSPVLSGTLTEVATFPPKGYWLATQKGAVFATGGAVPLGSPTVSASTGAVAGIAGTPTGKGYWVVTAKGAVYAFGDAASHGDLQSAGVKANDIVAIAPTYDGQGYWLVGRDGGLFAFGDARYHGSVPALGKKVQDIVGMVSSPTSTGYLLVGSDGGVFAFGSGRFLGSLPGDKVKLHDIRAILPAADGDGYVLVGSDGGAFVFGHGVQFHGSLPGEGIRVDDVVGIALSPDDAGYYMAASNGNVFGFGNASPFPTPAGLKAALPVVGIAGT